VVIIATLRRYICTIGVTSISESTFIDIEMLLGSAFEEHYNELLLEAGRQE